VKITVEARHVDASDSIREYVETKIEKLPRIYDNIQSVEVKLDTEAEHSVVEIIAQAARRHTFVATHRDQNMYACVDMCLDKIASQIRRFKDRVRDRHAPGPEGNIHGGGMPGGGT